MGWVCPCFFFCILDISLNPSVPGWESIFAQIFWVLLPFCTKVASHFQGSLYCSFLPAKQRDFPGNVRSGGCDSLPLVEAFTSKQHDSLLSYALHFLHVSHQMCCAGERAECRAHQSVGKSLRLPEKNTRKARAFSEECIRLSRAATSLLGA